MRPKTHQELLDAWVQAELSVIDDRSGNFAADWRQLISDAETYAAAHGLHTEALNDTREELRIWEDDA